MSFTIYEPQILNCLFLIFLINPFLYWFSFFFYKIPSLIRLAKYSSRLSLFLLFCYLSLRWLIGHYFPIRKKNESFIYFSDAFYKRTAPMISLCKHQSVKCTVIKYYKNIFLALNNTFDHKVEVP